MTPELTKLMEEKLSVLKSSLPASNSVRQIHGDSINKIIEDSWVAGFTAAVKAMEEKESGLLADARELQRALVLIAEAASGRMMFNGQIMHPWQYAKIQAQLFFNKYGSAE